MAIAACLFLADEAGAQTVMTEARTDDLGTALPPTDAALLKAQADGLFKQILLHPDDLRAAFAFAELETRLGDYEAAIGSYERMLFYNSDLPRVKFELGVLYFRLGSYAMSRSYFAAALTSRNTPPDLRDRALTFEAEIDRRLSPNQFSFFGQTGVRYQSNADVGPNSPDIRVSGATAALPSQYAHIADGNAFILGNIRYIYDFENQRGDIWETNATGYYAGQFKLSDFNLGVLEVNTGPRLALGAGSGFSIRPYLLGGNISLGDEPYLAQGGGGLDLRYRSRDGFQIDVGAEGRDRRFFDSAPYPYASDQRGYQVIVPVGLSGPTMITGLRWQTRLSYVNTSAFANFDSYNQFGVELVLPYEFVGPFSKGHHWTLAPFASYFDIDYAKPDGLIDPNVTRHDRLLEAGATLDMRFRDNIGFAVTAQYVETQSNLPNFRTRDFTVSIGPTVRY